MTPQEINIEIAKVRGYRFDVYRDPEVWHPPPDYYHDLNAMHEAEKVLTEQNWIDYLTILEDICQLSPESVLFCDVAKPLVHATAAQRAEAFLRTLNLLR